MIKYLLSLSFLFTWFIHCQGQTAYAKLIQSILDEKCRQCGVDENRGSVLSSPSHISARDEQEIRVSDDGDLGEEGEPVIAVNPLDSNNVAVSFIHFFESGGPQDYLPVYFSLDGGLSWEKSSFDTRTPTLEEYNGASVVGAGDPVLEFDNNGRLYFGWINLAFALDYPGLNIVNTYWAWSDDQGASFQLAEGDKKKIMEGAFTTGQPGVGQFGDGVFDRPWFAVDKSGGPNDGSLYASGLFLPNDTTSLEGQGMVVRVKRPDEDSFLSENSLFYGLAFGNSSKCTVDDNGTIHVVFWQTPVGQPGSIMYSQSSNGGQNFEEPIPIGIVDFEMDETLVYIRENAQPGIAVGKDGKLMAVWTSFNQDGTFEGFFTHSEDGGNTWAEQVQLDELLGLQNASSFMPTITAGGTAKVFISYYAVDPDLNSHFQTATSSDNGESFDEAITHTSTVTDFDQPEAHFFGDYFSSVTTGCKTWSVWADGRDTAGPRIYVGITEACEPVSGLAEISPVTDFIQVGQAFPNPNRGNFILPVHLKKQGSSVEAYLTDSQGHRLVKIDTFENLPVGNHDLKMTLPNDFPSGNYLVTLHTEFGRAVRKIVVD